MVAAAVVGPAAASSSSSPPPLPPRGHDLARPEDVSFSCYVSVD